MNTDGLNDPDPISVGITRRVKPDRVAEFEAWIDEIRGVVSGFEGYVGMDVVRPVDPSHPTYVIILRFDSFDRYSLWRASSERASIVEQSMELTEGEPVLEEAHGLEGWFTPPAVQPSPGRPARYKMAILTVVGLYPLILVIGRWVADTTQFPPALGTLVTVSIVATLATYWVMPWITRFFRRWLFPNT
ncbi:MAG: antibiotic biosynthesis monooxygenase [Chloroflexi bacterium]|nr:antibiotic biosynthesis monooxygenase [Chloroflexota bacterium]